MKIHIAFNGAGGRMGQRLVALAKEDHDLKLVAALDAPGSPLLGRDAGEVAGVGHVGVPITAELAFDPKPDCLIDFSAPEGTMTVLPVCVARQIPIVVATTGHTAKQKEEIEAAAHQTAVLFAPNMSLVVNLLFKLTKLTAEALKGKGFDAEIVERHHRFKKDSPSGTAVRFGEIIQEVQGGHFVHGREGLVGERTPHEIGVHAVRGGDNVGEHTIIFTTLGETLELVHKGHNRDSYARGALAAGKYLANRPAGRYTMADVLGL
ncbi:dihydrodipicolinate reductase : 4-hydroxy-tetrahydrodipicolinate reductase OS=Planctomyces limnophilus (strain ATCC 43296 / DSM 3776 / IFAM 1008 / 290) GN=dapB PE=3 SV=1: DapB_N: DapB_C [Gemmataceae bacterium]|nr:dihydrodipicolinate reductase : 4-hydroxy-tetrahydrodipicolinate reductase OS=Planctomyces limnophilus (strain ATCC 43296 / DSM 3776 / IFAM 1008 / 290) GN=dapB PE=3 SV=1: DapB_N: DapB_C [Gemmataceae bacterium]VTT97515.1 dihydrodipicolinate reductase : 4-hydroxy-tetrahydrodipicolinate reductase OS=Planctomyces limnophilus (strain ATCC 43296 / DSM 3776 / IFAM 1008 / 290) GN=dapB PE=3 SV=1: DapB_N: DapB_C [Gemmataceae bacterium]